MNFFQFAQAHEILVWALFLVPLFICMTRFVVLEERAGRPLKYTWVFVCGLIPVVNIGIAVVCVAVTFTELFQRLR